MDKTPQALPRAEAESLSFVRIAECLYRNPSSGTYYGLLKKHGKQIKRSLRTKNLPEARRKLRDFKSEHERIDPDAASVTVAALCEKYIEGVSKQAASTVSQKERLCGRMKACWSGVPARKIRKSDILSFLSKQKGGASVFNHRMQTVRAVFEVGVDDRILVENPAAKIDHMTLPKPIRTTPSEEDFHRVVANIRTQPGPWAQETGDYVEFISLAGLGKAETAALQWGDVNMKKRQLISFRKKTTNGFVIPIFPQLLPLFERRLIRAKEVNGGRPPPPTVKVFSLSDAKTAINNATRRLGLPHYTTRSFRRLFITFAIEQGVDVKVIAKWQGHKDGGKLILDTYSHVREVHSENMAKLMTMGSSLRKENANAESQES